MQFQLAHNLSCQVNIPDVPTRTSASTSSFQCSFVRVFLYVSAAKKLLRKCDEAGTYLRLNKGKLDEARLKGFLPYRCTERVDAQRVHVIDFHLLNEKCGRVSNAAGTIRQ